MRPFIALLFVTSALFGDRVYVDMVADLFHRGHIELLKKARAEGDYLIVGIHSDEEVTPYKRKPIMNTKERMAAVAASGLADELIENAPLHITEEYLKLHKIDLVVHGDDISAENMEKMYGVPIKLGKFKLLPYTQGISTSELLNRMKESLQDSQR